MGGQEAGRGRLSETGLQELLGREWPCGCGKRHSPGSLAYLKIGPGAAESLPEAMAALGLRRLFIAADPDTHAAAWPLLGPVLEGAGIPHVLCVLDQTQPEPDEHAVGALALDLDPDCDGILAVGSGVIGDCCKVLAHGAGKKLLTLGTAPSMDGYASASSSMIQRGVKVTLYNGAPAAILADTRILCRAPFRLLQAGLGDMLAKYISLCEWRIAHLVTGEYYCEEVAALMRRSLTAAVRAAPGLARREQGAVEAITEGLILSGVAMTMAGASRPASGTEHYFSHIWEMMALQRGEKSELHGIQVGVGTCLALKILARLRGVQPDRERAERFVAELSPAAWEARMRDCFGAAADGLIQREYGEYHKNDPAAHRARLQRILEEWPRILRAIDEEVPPAGEILSLMRSLNMPTTPAELGIRRGDTDRALHGSRDVRDKYLSTSLLWDLGLLYDFSLEDGEDAAP